MLTATGTIAHARCELCDRSLGFATPGGGSGACHTCRAFLESIRSSPLMTAGRRVAAVLALSGELSADLAAYRLGQAAREGRLAGPLARAAGIKAGRFACKVCGLVHLVEVAAADCCAALPSPNAGDDPDQFARSNEAEPVAATTAGGETQNMTRRGASVGRLSAEGGDHSRMRHRLSQAEWGT